MIQNMGRGAAAAMFQRSQMLANQQQWLDYVQARDGGAFVPSGYVDASEYLPGQRPQTQTNPYLRYYVQMQRDAMDHQRRVALQWIAMQRQMEVQQQEFDLRQQHEKMKIQLSEKERQDKLLEVRKRREKIQNDDRFSKAERAHYDRQAALEEADLSDTPKLFTYTQEDSGYFYPENYPVKDLRGKPIPNKIQLDNQTGEKTIVESGKELYQDYQGSLEKAQAHNLAKEKEANENSRKFAEAYFKNKQLEKAEAEKEKEKQPRVLTREEERAGKGVYIGDDAKKTLNEESAQYAHQQYKDKMIKTLRPNHPDMIEYTSQDPSRKEAIEEKWDAEVDRQIDAGSGDAWDLFDQHRQKKLPLDFGYQEQDTGEMFAAQDPGMMEQPFTDPGMEFDPADDAYIMDEEFV